MSKLVYNEESYEIVRLGQNITMKYQNVFRYNDEIVKGVEITEEVIDGQFIFYKVYKDGEFILNHFINNLNFTIRDMVDIIQNMKNHKLI